jgi:hypothetical protein
MTQRERRIAYAELKMAEKSANGLQVNMAKYDCEIDQPARI